LPRVKTQDEKFKMMTETPVGKLIFQLATPTVLSMLITSIYNMADTYFVGRINTSATGGVGIAFALMALIQATGFTFGSGSGAYVSRLLGQKNNERASQVAATGAITAFFAGLVITVLGLLFLDPMVRILGATDTIVPYAKDYIRFILLGAPIMCSSFVLNNLLRFQGSALFAMVGLTAGGLINIGLDPLFIFVFHMGVAGAAIATIISQFISFCILLFQCTRGGNIKISIKNFRLKGELHATIIKNGFPSFCRQGLTCLVTILMNNFASVYGDAAIAAMTVVNRVFQFLYAAILGVGQGFQPICGFNYGARRYDRVLKAFAVCLKATIGTMVVLASFCLLFAPSIIHFFRDDPDVVLIGAKALRFQAVAGCLCPITVLVNMLTQTMGKSGRATVLASSRQGIFYLPLILILPPVIGLLGIQLALPVSDVCSSMLALFLVRGVIRELRTPLSPVVAESGDTPPADSFNEDFSMDS